jgi:hypothetical protein
VYILIGNRTFRSLIGPFETQGDDSPVYLAFGGWTLDNEFTKGWVKKASAIMIGKTMIDKIWLAELALAVCTYSAAVMTDISIEVHNPMMIDDTCVDPSAFFSKSTSHANFSLFSYPPTRMRSYMCGSLGFATGYFDGKTAIRQKHKA